MQGMGRYSVPGVEGVKETGNLAIEIARSCNLEELVKDFRSLLLRL